MRLHRRCWYAATTAAANCRSGGARQTPSWFQASCLIPRIVIHSCLLCFHCAFSLAAAFLLPPPSTVRVTRTVQISIGLPCSHATRAFVSPLDRACVQSPTFGFLFFFLPSSPFLHLVTRGEEERRRSRFVMIGCRAPVVSRLFWKLKGERDGRCCRDFEIRRLESL